jgi:hypothetical protein
MRICKKKKKTGREMKWAGMVAIRLQKSGVYPQVIKDRTSLVEFFSWKSSGSRR